VSGTDVSGTEVSGTDVSGTEVSGTDVSGTDVSGTDVGAPKASATQSPSVESILATDLTRDLLAYFLRRLDDREDAADCLSETLLILWRRRRALPRDRDSARAWAFGAAKRVLANHRRGRIRHSTLADRLRSELAIAPAAEAPALEVREALSALAADDRELVMLIAWDGFGVAEAGAVLGLKPDASRVRYHRARLRLRELLA
jgi:RNA polymerase sigma-70 factor, ECF subfamily